MSTERSGREKRLQHWWERFAQSRATHYARNPDEASELVDKVVLKARRLSGQRSVKEIWGDIQTLGRFVRAWSSGRYREVPMEAVVFAVGALAYFFCLQTLSLISFQLPGIRTMWG